LESVQLSVTARNWRW